ncbi:MAG: hypothetical protein HKL96_06810 [Phycisphaerales bacterium]|nr:hypothetical protein [Phycisphaerales bacterium]
MSECPEPSQDTLAELLPYCVGLQPHDVGNAAQAALPTSSAVYLLLAANDAPILLAVTSNVRAAVERKMHPPDQAAHAAIKLAGVATQVRYRLVRSALAANWWYYRCARLLYPQQYTRMLGWQPAWFVACDAVGPYPRFWAANRVDAHEGTTLLGPLARQTAAQRVVELLENIFDLCRYDDLLKQSPKARPCSYKDMGKCTAVCDGTISMEHYRKQIAMALRFVEALGAYRDCGGEGTSVTAFAALRGEWEGQMRQAAGRLDFRMAAAMKARLAAADELLGPRFMGLRDLRRCAGIALQTGGGSRQIEPFFFRGGSLDVAPAVMQRHLPEACSAWALRLAELRQSKISHQWDQADVELAGLLAHHLTRHSDTGLYLFADEVAGADDLHRRIMEWLATRRRHSGSAGQQREDSQLAPGVDSAVGAEDMGNESSPDGAS